MSTAEVPTSSGPALLLAVLGAASNNIGKVRAMHPNIFARGAHPDTPRTHASCRDRWHLGGARQVIQKRATQELPQLAFERKVLLSYAASSTWRIGLLADVGGAIATLLALSRAPVSLIQPVGGCGMAVLALFSRYYLREELQLLERVGVALAVAGTIGVGLTAAPPAGVGAMPNASAGALLLVALVLGFGVLEGALRHVTRQRSANDPPVRPRLQELADNLGLAGMDNTYVTIALVAAAVVVFFVLVRKTLNFPPS